MTRAIAWLAQGLLAGALAGWVASEAVTDGVSNYLVQTTAIGGVGLVVGTLFWWRAGWRPPLIVVDLWFAAYGALPLTIIGSDQSPGPNLAAMAPFMLWLVAGIVGAIAVARSPRRVPEPEAAALDR